MNMNVGERIKQRRKQLGMTAEQLGKKIGKGTATIYRYENGEIEKIDASKLMPIADALLTTPAYLMGWEGDDSARYGEDTYIMSMRRIPILGDTAAGLPTVFANREYDEYIEVPEDGHKFDAAVRVTGDSMEPGYKIGDLALIRYQDDVLDGQIAVVCLDDTVTLKRIYKDKDSLVLISDNRKYPPIRVSEDDIPNIHLTGRAVGVIHWED